MADVFISHVIADRKRVDALAAALEAEGLSVARAEPPARGARLGVREPVAEHACTIVCWSKASARSDEQAVIAAQAFNRGRLVPVFFHQVEPPFPYDRVQGVDISAWRGEPDDPAWLGVLHAVRATIGDRPAKSSAPAALAPPPAPPAPKPNPTPNLFQTPARPPAPPPEREAEAPPAVRARMAIFSLAGLALVIAALWGGPRLVALLNQTQSHRGEVAAPAAIDDLASDSGEADQTPTPPQPAAAQGPAATSTPAGPAVIATGGPAAAPPAPESAAAEEKTANAAPRAPPAGGAKPVAHAPAAPAATAAPADPATTMHLLEKCLGDLAKLCAPVDPELASSFAADGRLSAGERRLLSSSLFPDRSLVTAENLNACLAAVKAKASGALGRACPAIAPKVAPPMTTLDPSIPKPITTPPPEPLPTQTDKPIAAPPL